MKAFIVVEKAWSGDRTQERVTHVVPASSITEAIVIAKRELNLPEDLGFRRDPCRSYYDFLEIPLIGAKAGAKA